MKVYLVFIIIVLFFTNACSIKDVSSDSNKILSLLLISQTKPSIFSFLALSRINSVFPGDSKKKETNQTTGEITKLKPLAKSDFWILDAVSSIKSKKKANLVKETAHYKIWIQEGVNIGSFSMDDYAKELENNIYPVLLANTGKNRDINSDGKASILISNTIDNRSGGFVGGYVDPSDYTNTQQSNRKDILYMNSRLLARKSNFYATTAHELQHLHRVKYQIHPSGGYLPDSTWIDEGTAEYIADESGYGPQTSRVDCYYRSCTVNGTSVFDSSTTLGTYAFRYMFVSYVYHSASTDKTQRANFIYKLTTGFTDKEQKTRTTNGIRASSADNLFKTFHTYAPNHLDNTSVLGSNSSEIFYKLYGSFLLQTTSGFTTTSMARKDTGSRTMNFSSIVTKYPVPNFLTKVGSTPVKLSNPSNSVSLSADSGMFYFYRGVPSSGTSNYIDFQGTLNGNQVTLQYNYLMIPTSSTIIPSVHSSLDDSLDYRFKSHNDDTSVCIHDILGKKFEIRSNLEPNLYQIISE